MSVNAEQRFQQWFLLTFVVIVSAAFVWLIGGFLDALFLAALSAVMLQPVQHYVSRRLGGREGAAAIVTLVAAILIVGLPMLGLLALLASEAAALSEAVTPWIERQLEDPAQLRTTLLPEWLPGREIIAPYEAQITAKLGEFAGSAGQFLVNGLSRVTQGTVQFFLSAFVMLYSLFYFLRAGTQLVDYVLACVPMSSDGKTLLAERVLSVIRATVKGTFVIGFIQGGLAGLALLMAGIQGAVFWGAVMAVLSVIPGVGAALVWVPAVIYLFAIDRFVAAAAVAVWCAAVVGAADNVLRPALVGKDTQMPDLLVLLSTLGGLSLFGIVGIILGPMIATLFVAVWSLYRTAFAEELGETS